MTIDLTELLGNHYKLLELLPDYDDDVWLKVETEENFCLLDKLKCDVSFCKKAVRYELARLSEIEKTTDKVTADWSERCQKLEAERDRLANAMREILSMNAGEGGDSYAMQEFVRETLSDA